MDDFDVEDWIMDRKLALIVGTLATVNAYLVKYGEPPMPDCEEAYVAIHTARLSLGKDMPEGVKEASRQWLKDHGYSDYLEDGDKFVRLHNA